MLSKRLLKISELVDRNKVVYDVGSDHALLPCFLVMNNIINKAYAVDNKEGPLLKAKENIKKYSLEGKVIPVLSNGIDDINDDVNIITICGMGFYTVKDILDCKDLTKYDKIIVQTNKDTELLRKWISDNNYSIIDETIIEDDFFYEVVVFNASKGRKLSNKEMKFGPINLLKMDSVFIKYLNSLKEHYLEINKMANKSQYLTEINEINNILRK